MYKRELEALLKQLKNKNSDYFVDLYYQDEHIGCVYYSDDIDSISIEQRAGYLLVYTDALGVFIDDAKLTSI